MIVIILSIIFVISLACIASNYSEYKYIKETYKIIKNGKIDIIDNLNGTYTITHIASKSIFYKSGYMYNIQLFDRPMSFIINDWVTYFDPIAIYYFILINRNFKKHINSIKK